MKSKEKYRLGKKQKRAILEVETGREYLVFPQSKTEHVEAFLHYLNNISTYPDIYYDNLNRRYNADKSLEDKANRYKDLEN